MSLSDVIFTNDNNVKIKLIDHEFSNTWFKNRNNHEIMFRRINTFLILNKFINGNIIDLGSWIGDNSIPWAKNFDKTIYSIDPSPDNIKYIKQMAYTNNIENIITIEKAISDKNEIIGTNQNINHCSFSKNGGIIKKEAVTLDYLYLNNQINNISYIHLDVEGFEFNVIKGAEILIRDFKPIISFEQHLTTDNYKALSMHLYKNGYNIYLINEILPGCKFDCRNLFAFPNDKEIPIDKINNYVGENVLLSVLNWNNRPFKSLFTASLFGAYMNNKVFKNIKSVEYDDKHIFCVNDDNYTKIVVIDKNKNWICGKYLLGEINISCKESIINAFLSTKSQVGQLQYNIKDIIVN